MDRRAVTAESETATATLGRAATTPAGSPPRVTFVTDIATPYMVAQLDALARESALHVVFCAQTGQRALPWNLDGRLSFDHEVIGGLSLPGRTGGSDYHMSPRILGAIARQRPDVVIATAYSIPTVYASAYCAAFGRPLVIHNIGTARSERIIGHGQALARKVLLRHASSCAAGSVEAAERLQELGVPPGRIFMTSHTTELELLWRVGRERAYGERDVVRVLGVGRLIARKGFDRLLRAVATALQAGAPIELRIVGKGPDEASLRMLAGDLGITGSVRFEGFVDQAALPGVYADADVFAFPTRREPFGFVLLEAAATGLPAIASPEAGSTREVIEHEQSGLVVNPNDVEGMAAAAVRLSRDRSLRERLGRAAHEATLGRTPSQSARGFLEAVEAARGRGRRLAPA